MCPTAQRKLSQASIVNEVHMEVAEFCDAKFRSHNVGSIHLVDLRGLRADPCSIVAQGAIELAPLYFKRRGGKKLSAPSHPFAGGVC